MKNHYLKLLFQKKTTIILAILMVLLLGFAKSLVFVMILLLVNIALGLLVRPFKYFLAGIEIVTLITITTSLAYGGFVGMITGAIALITNLITIARITPRVFIFIPTMIVLAWIAPFFSGLGITAVGIAANLVYNFIVVLSVIFLGGDLPKGLIYVAINTVFNVFLFTAIAPGLLALMV